MTDETKYQCIINRKPLRSIKIPVKVYKDKRPRRKLGTTQWMCNRQWFETFDFLAYSHQQRGLYCLACVLFPTDPKEGATHAKKLITVPYDNWKYAVEDLKAHAKLTYHLQSESKM